MKNKFIKRISIFVLTLCLIIPVAAMMAMASDTAEVALEERVYQSGYEDSVIDLIKVKKAGDGTDIDGDAMNGNASDLEQMRNFIVGKTDAFYRTQGVKYEFDEETQRYHVISEQSCNAGIEKAEGTLTILSAYDDGKHGKATVTTVAEGAFSDCTEVTAAVMPTVTTLSGSTFSGCSNLVTVDMPKVATLKTSDNFASCSNLATAVVANQFSLSASNFSGEGQSVDICVAGINEPTLNMTLNEGLSGEIYHQNTNGACDTWTYDEEGAIVKAQHKHTFGEDGVCTNESCAVESINGLVFEKNYFAPRNASSLTVEKVDSYEDSSTLDGDLSGITEMNVAKVTTTGYLGDMVIILPQDVTSTLKVRILVETSDATHIIPRTVQKTGGENKNGEEIAPGTGLSPAKQDVWLDYTLDYSNVSEAYKDRLAIQVTGGTKHVFYVAYAIDSEEIKTQVASDLTAGYQADFSSSLYETIVKSNTEAGRTATVKAQKIDVKEDANGLQEKNVVKITTTANSNRVADFVLALPRVATKQVRVRMLVESSDATHIGFRTKQGGWDKYSGSYPGSNSDIISAEHRGVWFDALVDYSNTDEDAMDHLSLLILGSSVGGTHTVYLSYIIEEDQIQSALAADLQEGYVADFSSSLYLDYVKKGGFGTIETTWLPSYKGEEGVVKVVMDAAKFSNSRGVCEFTLPKSYDSSKYTMRLCIGENTDLAQIGGCTSGGGWTTCFYNGASTYTKEEWKDITVTAKSDGYDKAKIGIMGFTPGTKLEFYISWIKEAN